MNISPYINCNIWDKAYTTNCLDNLVALDIPESILICGNVLIMLLGEIPYIRLLIFNRLLIPLIQTQITQTHAVSSLCRWKNTHTG